MKMRDITPDSEKNLSFFNHLRFQTLFVILFYTIKPHNLPHTRIYNIIHPWSKKTGTSLNYVVVNTRRKETDEKLRIIKKSLKEILVNYIYFRWDKLLFQIRKKKTKQKNMKEIKKKIANKYLQITPNRIQQSSLPANLTFNLLHNFCAYIYRH